MSSKNGKKLQNPKDLDTSHNGNTFLLIVGIIGLVALGVGGFFLWKCTQKQSNDNNVYRQCLFSILSTKIILHFDFDYLRILKHIMQNHILSS